MEPDVTGVSSTPEPDAPSDTFAADEAAVLARLDKRSGKISPPPVASAPTKPVEQAASTDATAQPASEPGKPREKGAKARSAELDPEIAELREKLKIRAMLREELAKGSVDAKPAESSPAPQQTSKREYERIKAMPGAPDLKDYESFEEWNIDMTAFVADQRLQEYGERQQREAHIGKHNESIAKFTERGQALYPDFREVLQVADAAKIQWPYHVTQTLLTHEQGPAIAYALAQAKDDAELYRRITDKDDGPVHFGIYVGQFLAQQKPAPKSTVPSVTRAPEPPPTLGNRPHDKGGDPTRIGATDDFSTFDKGWLAKQRAGRA